MLKTVINIIDYLDQLQVIFLDVATQEEALKALVENLHANDKFQDSEKFYNAIMERERMVSTAIGTGVAIPHAKLPTYDNFFIAIGIAKNGIDWSALDGMEVNLIFMVGGPDDKQTQYLQILSALTLAVKDQSQRDKILGLTSPKMIIQEITRS